MSEQSASPSTEPDRKALIFILLTAFLNLAGIGLIGPVSPFLVSDYVSSPGDLAFVNGLLFTAYSLCQFLALPGLGALSDRYGRRPILLVCLIGSAVGYLLFGIGGSLVMLFLGRIIDGITGGNLSVITAYIADLTSPTERTKYFGMVGAIAGFGFVVGPALGGILAGWGGPTAPVYFAAVVTLVNVLWGYFVMPESLPEDKRGDEITLEALNPFGQLINIFQLPQLRWLLTAFFFVTVPFAVLQSNLSVLAKDSLNWRAANVAYLFAVVGVIGIIVQGGLIRVLLRSIQEIYLAIAGVVLMIISFIMMALIPSQPIETLMFASVAVFAIGNGLVTPSLTGLLSQMVGPREQGRLQGGNQSVQALGRVIGPLWGGTVYTTISASSTYWTGAIMFGVALLCVLVAMPTIQSVRSQTTGSS